METAVDAVQQIRKMDRRLVRQTFEARFGISQMAKNYLNVYKQLVQKDFRKKRRRPSAMTSNPSLQTELGDSSVPLSRGLP